MVAEWFHRVWAAQSHASWRVAGVFYFLTYALLGLALCGLGKGRPRR